MVVVPTPGLEIDLCSVKMRPTHGAREYRLWDRLMKEHHYLVV